LGDVGCAVALELEANPTCVENLESTTVTHHKRIFIDGVGEM